MGKAIELTAAENPEELLKLKVTEPKTWAAGIPAVYEAGKDVLKEDGLIRGLTALFHMNKKAVLIVPAAPGPIRMTTGALLQSIVRTVQKPWLRRLPPKS